jgi:hypothetical protein
MTDEQAKSLGRPTCETCPYFQKYTEHGECHKSPPSKNGWREVLHHDWCGEHPLFDEFLSRWWDRQEKGADPE